MSLVVALILLAVIALSIGVSLRGPRRRSGSSGGSAGDRTPWYGLGFFAGGGSSSTESWNDSYGGGGGGFDSGGGGDGGSA